MKSIEHWLVHDHTQFEVLFRQCHEAADISDWWALDQFFATLVEQLRYHMAQEEEVLFPAYDARCKPSHMPTLELYDEHSAIIASFAQLAKFIHDREAESTLSCIVVLELLMFQHNEKEEKVFLPFASHLLFESRDELAQDLDDFVVTEKSREWPV